MVTILFFYTEMLNSQLHIKSLERLVNKVENLFRQESAAKTTKGLSWDSKSSNYCALNGIDEDSFH